MKHYLKALGLALVAAFAFSAVAASGASAQTTEGHLTCSPSPCTLKGTEVVGGTNALTAFGSEVRCPETVYTGHKTQITPHQPLVSGETSITITPHYKGCNSGGSARTVKMNGCDYDFFDATTTGGVAGTYGLKVTITCPANSQIEVTGGPCTVKVPAQSGLTGLHATNEGGQIKLSGTITGLTSTCGFLHTSTAQQHQNVSTKGESAGETSSISISD